MNLQKKVKEDAGEGRDYLQGKDLSNKVNYKRDDPPPINEETEPFNFMQIDVDYYTAYSENLPSKSSPPNFQIFM